MGSSGQSAMDALAAKQAKIEADVQELEKRVRGVVSRLYFVLCCDSRL